jgi:DNA repair ATPase RecN
MNREYNTQQKDMPYDDYLIAWVRRNFDLPQLARKAGMHVQEISAQHTRFHGDLESLDAFAFDIGERRLEHCLEMLRKAGYSDAADFLQGVG